MQLKRVLAVAAILLVAAGGYFEAQRATAATSDPGSVSDPLVSKSYVDQYTTFRVMTVAKGQQLIGAAGSELILRGGDATINLAEGAGGGISDLTGGVDLGNGSTVPANHHLLIPRGDGRGFTAHSDVVVMVKGIVTIK